jgi:hypothetical protein
MSRPTYDPHKSADTRDGEPETTPLSPDATIPGHCAIIGYIEEVEKSKTGIGQLVSHG